MCEDTHIRFPDMPEGTSLTTSESVAYDLHDIRVLLATMVLIMESARRYHGGDSGNDDLADGVAEASVIVKEAQA